MPSTIVNPGTLAARRKNAAARKRATAMQILQREKFKSALCRRLQLELRQPSRQAKMIASRITSATPRDSMKGVKKMNLAELIKKDKARRVAEAKRRREAKAAAAAKVQPTATPAVPALNSVPQRVESPEAVQVPAGAFRIPLKTDRKWQADKHDIWADILQFRDKQEREELQQERAQLQAKRREQRDTLARQVAVKESQRRAAKMAVRRDLIRVQDDVKAFEKEEAVAAEARRKKSQNIMAQMIKQRDQHLAHKRRERARQLAEEQAYVKKIEQEEADAAREERERRHAALREMKRVQIENDHQLELKRQALKQEQIRAKELQDLRIAMMDAKERARVEALEERSRIIQEKVNNMNTFMAKVRDKEAEDMAKALRERAAYEKEQDRLDAQRKADAKRRLEEQHMVLQKQIALKHKLEQQQIIADRKRAEQMLAKFKEGQQTERREREQLREKERAYKLELQRQILERAQKRTRPDQTALDTKLNHELLVSMSGKQPHRPPPRTRKGGRPLGGGRRVVS